MSFPRYERYKDSGVEWLGEVPEHWRIARVKRLAEKIGSGKTPLGGSEVYATEGVMFLRSQNIHDDGLRLDDVVYITPEVDQEMDNTRVKPGDILLNVTGASIGRTCIVPTPFPSANVNQHVCIIRVIEPSLREYVAMALKSGATKAQIDLAQNGAARDGLNFEQIGNLLYAMPETVDESSAIIRFLERELAQVDGMIEEQRRLIELLKEKRQAVISHAVTKGLNPDAPMRPSGVEWLGEIPRHWTMKRLRVLFQPEKRQNHSDEQVLSVYRDYGVVLKDSRDDNMNKTPEDLSTYQLVKPNDLVVNKMKAWQGSLGISDFEGITSPDYIVFTPRHGECSAFLHLLLRSQRMVSVYRSISNGIRPAQWRLEPEPFLGLPIPLPPPHEQREVASFVTDQTSRFDNLMAEAARAINHLQERRSALISAAVTGKIDVRNSAPSESAEYEEAYEPA